MSKYCFFISVLFVLISLASIVHFGSKLWQCTGNNVTLGMFQISSITLKNSELEMAGLGIFAMKFYVNFTCNIQNVCLFGPRRSWFGVCMAMAKTATLRSNNFWNCLAANCGPWWVWSFFGTPTDSGHTPKRKNSRITFTLESLALLKEHLDLLSTDPALSLFHHPCFWHQNEQMVDNNHVSFWNGIMKRWTIFNYNFVSLLCPQTHCNHCTCWQSK